MDRETSDSIPHIPVLTAEVLTALQPVEDGLYLDGTLGMGGHSKAVLEKAPGSRICGLDKDSEALAIARVRLADFTGRVNYFHLPFSKFDEALDILGWQKLNGALLDLGVSSLQLDKPERGFSFKHNARPDMRMDGQNNQPDACHFINHGSFEDLKNCFQILGEEPMAGRIARNIIETRAKQPIESTKMLSDIVWNSYPAKWRKSSRNHPATRVFQAIRIKINDELAELEKFLTKILSRLAPGARLAIITFHSLEDRIVKHTMKNWAKACICPPQLQECVCGHASEVKILYKKPLCPTKEEIAKNLRARSAKLRVVEKIGI